MILPGTRVGLMVKVFNYPWSGRLGHVVEKCIYCGSNSTSLCCCRCDPRNKIPTSERFAEAEENYFAVVKKWCEEHDLDYIQQIDYYGKKYGPMYQQSPIRIQQQGEDF